MILGFLVTCFFAYTIYRFIIMELVLSMHGQVNEVKISYSDGVVIVVTLFLFAYTIPFLVLNRKRMRTPLELWEIYSPKTLSVISIIALCLMMLVGFVFKKFEINFLESAGYEYSHTKENHRSFGFDSDIYILVEKH
ncbi:hypothetical protein CTT30_01975 [Vibrio coralliilyticus]|nr:hypothetical protein CTT30_01975 [Vibrio coralliilyticus]